MVQVEAHQYLPETWLREFCKGDGIVFLAFAPLGDGIKLRPLADPVISTIAARARESLNVSALPQTALEEINRSQTRQRFNEVVKTGSPGFIPQGR